MRQLLALTVVAILALPAGAAASSPNAFDDDYDAALAVSGTTQWLIVGGVDKKPSGNTYGIRAYERSGEGRWHALPPLPGRGLNSASSLQAVVQGVTKPYPCFLYPEDRGPRLECLRGGRWKSAVGSQLRGTNVGDLIATSADTMAVIYTEHVGKRVLTSVARSEAGGRWQDLGKPLEGIILAQFEHADTPGPLRIGVEHMKRQAATRYVAELSNGRWNAITPLDRTREGPFVGGPINIAGARYFPLTDAGVQPFQFSVLTLTEGATAWLEVGGGSLSAPSAAGQGGVAIVDGAPWAIWQEDEQRGRGFRSTVEIADLSVSVVTPVVIWRGKRIGPGPLELVDTPTDTAYVLYTRGTAKDTLRVTIDAINP
jgi:hypothetical protein